MKLLIDIGNTRIKSAIIDGANFLALPATANSDMQIGNLWTSIQHVDSIWIASVASDAATDKVTAAAREHFAIEPRFARSTAEACGVRNAYGAPERLGVDRFLSLIAVHATRQASVVASCGTALTLDAIDDAGRHLGGLIAPSPHVMQESLRKTTARLKEAPDADIVDIAKDTDTGIASGTWLAAVSLVERFVKQASIRLNVVPQLVLTGGGANRLGALISLDHRIEPNLVLQGLALFADAHT